MLKLEKFVNQRIENFHNQFPEGPKLQIKRTPGKREGFTLQYSAGTVTLTAHHSLGTCFGLRLLEIAAASGHLANFTGEHNPKFPLRPLWIDQKSPLYQLDNDQEIEAFCFRILSLGYNAVILEECSLSTEKFKESGLKVIRKIKGTCSVLDDSFAEQNSLIDQAVDYVFWESTIYQSHTQNHPRARDYLEEDLALLEISQLEKMLPNGCRLIYSIPCNDYRMASKQSSWMQQLCEDVSPSTTVAFPAVAGNPTADHLRPHPLWEKLREGTQISHYNLMPLINIGSVNQGEGFWPVMPLDLISRYISRCNTRTFSGTITMTTHVPNPEALLSCSLWVAAHMQWETHQTPEALAESWFSAYRCSYDARFFESLRNLAIDLSRLKGKLEPSKKEEYRILAESLFSRLKYLLIFIEKEPQLPLKIKNYFTHYYRDARRFIFHFLQSNHLPIVCSLDEDDLREAFWTTMSTVGDKKVILLDQPNQGDEESSLREIYNDLFGSKAFKLEENLVDSGIF